MRSIITALPALLWDSDAVGGTPDQRHASGMYEAIDKGYQKLGLKFIAAASSATRGYHIVLRAPVSPAGDLAGRKIRGTPSYNTVINAGGSPVVLPAGEVYSSIEKGVVDGAAWPAVACSACAGTRSPNTCCGRASGSARTCS